MTMNPPSTHVSPMRAYAGILFAVLVGCSSPGGPDSTEPEGTSLTILSEVRLGKPFTLAPGEGGENAAIGLVVRFTEVASDSRCPDNVSCVWEGDAELVVRTVQNGIESTHRLHTHGQPIGPAAVDLPSGHRLELVRLDPGTRADRPIPEEEYRATFRVADVPEG